MLRVGDGNELLRKERADRRQQRGDEVHARLGGETCFQDAVEKNDGAVLQTQRQQMPAQRRISAKGEEENVRPRGTGPVVREVFPERSVPVFGVQEELTPVIPIKSLPPDENDHRQQAGEEEQEERIREESFELVFHNTDFIIKDNQ